jgi:hypothetical protein
MYSVDDFHNTKQFHLPEEPARELSSTGVVDLIVMPGYPTSVHQQSWRLP